MIKIIIGLLFVVNMLFSFEDFEYTLDVSNQDIMLHEAVIISLEVREKKSKDVLEFDFFLPESDGFKMQLMKSTEHKDSQGRTYVKSRYLLYPLVVGDLKIKPSLTVKRVTLGELKKFVTGSADELRYLQTRNKTYNLPPFTLTVHGIEKDVMLVGNYKLTYHVDKKDILSNEQVNLEYILSGLGYKPAIKSILKKIKGVDIFEDKELFDNKLSHKIVFSYALESENDFVIPAVSIVAYNPKVKKRYVLKTPFIKIAVKHVEDSQTPTDDGLGFVFSWQKYLNYMLLFIAGFITQKLLKNVWINAQSKEEDFVYKVKKAKSAKELLKILLAQKSRVYKNEINQLELVCYHDKNIALSKLKECILHRKRDAYHDRLLLPIISKDSL